MRFPPITIPDQAQAHPKSAVGGSTTTRATMRRPNQTLALFLVANTTKTTPSRTNTSRTTTSTKPRSVAWLLLLLTLGVQCSFLSTVAGDATTSHKDWFDIVDANRDGTIDHAEYDAGIDRFLIELEQHYNSDTAPRRTTASATRSMTAWLSELFGTTSTSTSNDTNTNTIDTTNTNNNKGGFWKAFTSSVAMILATEIGDKTFFIAAVLSMKHPRGAVFGGAILALTVMTILSTLLGLVVPQFLDRQYTHILSGLLFLYFGVKLVRDSTRMEGGKVSEELEEVEGELLLHQNNQGNNNTRRKKKGDDEDDNINTSDTNMEEGHSINTPTTTSTGTIQRKSSSTAAPASTSTFNGNAKGTHHQQQQHQPSAAAAMYAVVLTSLTLTFVAEWGDRSQIATIALASSKNPVGVTVGGIVGHSICTASACIGGRLLASNISEKAVSQWGGVVFLLFGIHSLFFEE